MKRIASLALVLVMIVALFAGCASSGSESKLTDQEKLVGTWKGDLDMTKTMMEELGEGVEGFELDEFKVTAVFTFTQEGTYTMELDEESVQKAMDGLIAGMEGFMKTMMEEMAKEAGMTLEDMLAASGMTMEDMMSMVTEELEGQDLVGEMVKDAKSEGKYKAENGKLYLSESLDAEVDINVYDTYTLEGDVLTLTATYGADEEETDMMKSVYPIVLKKAA